MNATLMATGLAFVLLAFACVAYARKRAFAERVESRLEARLQRRRQLRPVRDRSVLEAQLWAAGVQAGDRFLAIVAGVVLLGGVALALLFAWWAALLWGLAVLVAVGGWVRWMQVVRSRRVVEQLPAFLDQVIRGLETGSSMHNSLVLAARDAPDPVGAIMARVRRNVDLGGSLEDALAEVAAVYRLEPLQILAAGVRINARHGGRATDVLRNIIHAIRQQERWRRELRAMTGETRFTALVLVMLPLLVAAWMGWQGTEYLLGMWNDAGGRRALVAAAVLQVTGALVLWRMLRSI